MSGDGASIDRFELGGLGFALLAHAALGGAFLLAIGGGEKQKPPVADSIEVSLIDDVALVSQGPSADEAKTQFTPEPAPIEPAPEVPEPAPKPEPQKPKPEPAKERPDPKAKPEPKTSKGGSQQGTPGQSANNARPTGRLGAEFEKGLTQNDSPGKSEAPKGAVMTTAAATNIASAIARQIQPCADRQVSPGPGAEDIVVSVQLYLNEDGSMARRPTIRSVRNDASNARYVERVKDLAIASFVGCAPLRGLPAELYAVPRGWRQFTMTYKLPG